MARWMVSKATLGRFGSTQLSRAFQLACSMWCIDCVVLDIHPTSTMFRYNTKPLDVVNTSIYTEE